MNIQGERAHDALVQRYVAVWNEPDPERRRATMREIWPEDGAHVSPSYDVRGYEALEERIAKAHARWVATEGYVFRIREEPVQHHGVLKFRWEMVPKDGAEPESVGIDFFILNSDGRAQTIYQFIEA